MCVCVCVYVHTPHLLYPFIVDGQLVCFHNLAVVDNAAINIWVCVKKLWCIYTMEYYSAIKKNEILLFAMTWMELECIMLSEISQQRKTNTILFHSYLEFKKQNR